MLSDKELKILLKTFGIKWKGIVLKDQLQNKTIHQGFYIYNLDSKSNPVQQNSLGTHWVCSVSNDQYVF